MTTNQNKQISNNCVFDLIVEHELGFIEATLLTNVIADANNGRSRMVGEIAANYYQLLNYCEEFNYSRRGYTSKPTALAFVNELRKTYGMTNNQAQLCTLIVSWDDANDLAEMVDFIEHHSMVGKGAFDRNAPLGAVWRYCIEYNLPYFAGVVMNDLMDTRTDLLEYKTAISNFENLCIQFQKSKPNTAIYPDPVVLMGHPVFELPWMSPKLADVFKALANLRTMNDLQTVVDVMQIEKDAYIDCVRADVRDPEVIVANGMPIICATTPKIPTDY